MHSFSGFNEIERALRPAADLLGTVTDKLAVLDEYALPLRVTRFDKNRDRVIRTEGLPGLPFIQSGGCHTQKRSTVMGYGLLLMENRLDPSLRYVLLVTRCKEGYHRRFPIVPKGKVGRLYRLLTRAAKLSGDVQKPILAPGLIEDVLHNTLGFLAKARRIQSYGVRIQRGVVLQGAAGNGKSYLCRYIKHLCYQRQLTWSVVTASAIEKAFVDNTLDQLFRQSTVTFFDDIDISYLSRSASGDARKACSILAAMDGMDKPGNVVRIFTTNEEIDGFDPAFLRPGRIDKVYRLGPPDLSMRKRLTQTWPKEILDSIDADYLSEATEGASFAEIESVRAQLVAKFVTEGHWDLDWALEGLDYKRQENKRLGMGFVT